MLRRVQSDVAAVMRAKGVAAGGDEIEVGIEIGGCQGVYGPAVMISQNC